MTISKYFRPAAVLVLAASVLLLGCDSNETEPDSPNAELNLETLEAETEYGTLDAERIDASYVTAMGEGQAIGIALIDGEDGSEPDAEPEIVVSLYERGDLAVCRGELNSEGEAALESVDQSDFDATLEVAVEEETATGTLTFGGEEATFTAEAASGVSGVYWAEGTDEDPNVSGSWVVLPDERQWGCACLPPFTSLCCRLAL